MSESDEPIAVACQRVSDRSPRRPHVDSDVLHCSRCNEAVWAAKTSQEVLSRLPRAFLCCLECLLAHYPESLKTLGTSAAQDEELIRLTGRTAAEIYRDAFGHTDNKKV